MLGCGNVSRSCPRTLGQAQVYVGVIWGVRTGHRFQPSFREQVLSYMESATSGQSTTYRCASALRDRLGRVKLVRDTNLHNRGLCSLCIFSCQLFSHKLFNNFPIFLTTSLDFLEYLAQKILPNLRKFQENLARICHIRGYCIEICLK